MTDKNFDAYMTKFKEKPLKEKQDIILTQLKVLVSFTNSMCVDLKIDNQILLNRELIDLNDNVYTDDDFLEAILVLINSLQNSLIDFNDKLVEVMDFIMNKSMEE